MSKEQTTTCCICGQLFIGWGNNPWPVKEHGQCCNICNMDKVLPARIQYAREVSASEE